MLIHADKYDFADVLCTEYSAEQKGLTASDYQTTLVLTRNVGLNLSIYVQSLRKFLPHF